MKIWPKGALRALGGLDIALALVGIFYLSESVTHYGRSILAHPELARPNIPHVVELYWGGAALELLCIVFLVLTGLSVVRLQPRGLWMTNVFFGFQIVRFLATANAVYALVQHPSQEIKVIAMTIIAATQMAGTDVGFIVGFPLIALVITNLGYHSLRRADALSERFT